MTHTGTPKWTRRIVFAGGGSGGHLTPSLAIAAALLQQDSDLRVVFVTSGRDIDRRVLRHSAIARDPRCERVILPITQPPTLNWSGPLHLWSLLRSVAKCVKLLRSRPADVVVATGAFASVPGLLAAKRLKIPTVLFEANAVPGRVNRWWAPRSAMKFSGWPVSGVGAELAFEAVGMPVRHEASVSAPARHGAGRQLLIVGGSQGSRRLNEIVRAALPRLNLPGEWKVLHQTGPGRDSAGVGAPASNGVQTVPFIDDLLTEMRRSDLVISRAGAVTLGELAAAGCPAILIPMDSAAENHQNENARRLEKHGAAVVVRETDLLAGERLKNVVVRLIEHPEDRAAMSTAMKSLHRADAAELIARRLIDLAEAG